MLAGLIASCALAADPELTVTPLGVARLDGLVRIAVQMSSPPADDGGQPRIDADLLDGDRPVASASIVLDRMAALAGRTVIVLPVPSAGRNGLRVRAIASWAGPPGLPRRAIGATAPLQTPAAMLARAIASVATLRASGTTDPLPWLRAEQIAEFAAGGADAASIGEMEACAARLDAWLAGERPQPRAGGNELALRDPVDGSVQPWRLHLPDGAGPFPCALLLTAAAPGGKARWPASDGRLVHAALGAGMAVVECYAAGDRTWSGAARRRIALALAEAQRLGAIDGARGVALAPLPLTLLPFPVRTVEAACSDPAWWREAAAGRQTPPPTPGSWATSPFALVVGTGEHAAAVAANRRLAASFRSAYAAHAQALVEPLDDTCDPALLARRNLVLIGNPRSNRVLAALGLRLPFTWDHRAVTGPAGFHAMRAAMPALACEATTPDGRMVLVLDGAPPPWGTGLPLAGCDLPLAQAGAQGVVR